jgi:hypothetical protein
MSDQVHIWCENCRRFVTHEPNTDHQQHKRIGIRNDILTDSIVRLVAELKRTDRIVEIKS